MSKKKVLLIEDYAPWWGRIEEVLEKHADKFEFIDYDYDGMVESVEQGMDLINEYRPDVVVLDHSLSGGHAHYNREGSVIAERIKNRGIEIISFSSHSKSKIQSYYPDCVKHFADKDEEAVLDCLLGRCDCLK